MVFLQDVWNTVVRFYPQLLRGVGNTMLIALTGTVAGLLIGMLTSLVITAVMLLFGRNILSCFISSGEEAGGETLEIAFRYLKIMSICLPVLYVLHIVRSTIQGMGNTVIPLISGISELVMRTGAALLLPAIFSQNGILFA